MLLIKRFFKVDVAEQADVFNAIEKQNTHHPEWRDFVVENPNLNGIAVSELPFLDASGIIITRILHDELVSIATPESKIYLGDAIRLVGEPKNLRDIKMLIGQESQENLKNISENIFTNRFIVTNKEVIGKSVGELRTYYGATIPRIHRSPDVEFTPHNSTLLHFGDELNVVGSKQAMEAIEPVLGNSIEAVNHPQIVPVFIGIALGVILGSWPFFIPGIPSGIKLGLAGGPLIVAIVLSRIASWGTMTWHLPKSSNIILKDMGIVLFLACVGLHSGDKFIDTLVNGEGLFWMLCASAITFLPLICVAFVAKAVYKVNFLSICGMLAGSMTDPPALAFANSFSASSAVSVAYATVYPLVMILRIISAQLIVLFFLQ